MRLKINYKKKQLKKKKFLTEKINIANKKLVQTATQKRRITEIEKKYGNQPKHKQTRSHKSFHSEEERGKKKAQEAE